MIDHALRFTAPATRSAHIYPARHDAGSGGSASLPPMGLRVRLKASFDLSRLSPQARVIAVALQHYGMILADNGSPWYVTGAAQRQLGRQRPAHAGPDHRRATSRWSTPAAWSTRPNGSAAIPRSVVRAAAAGTDTSVRFRGRSQQGSFPWRTAIRSCRRSRRGRTTSACSGVPATRAARPRSPTTLNKGLDGAIFELLNPFHAQGAGRPGAQRRRQPARPAQPLGARLPVVARPHGAQPKPAAGADDAEPARPVRDLQRRRRQHPPHAAPEPAAALPRARQLRRPAAEDHGRPGHAAVAERRRVGQVGAERELRPRGDGAVLPGQRPGAGVAHLRPLDERGHATPRPTSTRPRGR